MSADRRVCPLCDREFDDEAVARCPDDGAPLLVMADPDALIGRTIAHRFTITRRLGSGGMGEVYVARQRSVGRDVAIKVMHASRSQDSDAARRFVREARLAASLSHPNIVAVIDFGQDAADGTLFLAMELLDGSGLDALLAFGPLPVARVARIGVQICDALAAAHQRGVVHRDLKPQNILVVDPHPERDTLKVLDFGLAKSLGAEGSTLTRPGVMFGTPAYLSPEMVAGLEVGPGADLYALGVILFEAIEGRLPFEADTLEAWALAHATAPAPPLSPGVPPAMATIVRRLLAKDPAGRYASAEAARDALLAVANEGRVEPVAPAPRGASAPTPAPSPATTVDEGTTWRPAPSRAPRWVWPAIAAVAAGLAAWAIAGGSGQAPTSSTPTAQLEAPTPPDAAAPAPAAPEDDAPDVVSAAAVAELADTTAAAVARPDEADTSVVAVAALGEVDAASVSADAGAPDAAATGEADPDVANTAAAETVTLELRAAPWAWVSVDGAQRVRTPVTLKLPRAAGQRVVRFSRDGFRGTTRSVAGDSDGKLSVTLTRVEGFILP